MVKRLFGAVAVLVGIMSVTAGGAQAQALFGAEGMIGSETDFGIGGRVLLPLRTQIPFEFQGSFDIFFPEGSRDYWELNGNVWYPIQTRGTTNAVPYVGGGLNIGHVSGGPGSSDTELGVNVGGGVRFEFTNTTPFLEARFVLGGVDQFVIGGGVLFGRF